MRAIQVTRLDGPASVAPADIPEPEARGRVVIDVHAAGVTYPDVLLTRGLYQAKPNPPFVPGSEAAGVVVSAPPASGFSAGDRVAAFPGFGAFAERIAADPRFVFPLPDRLTFEQGCGLPINYLTAHFALLRRGRLRAGETVLVHGAAGGVGTASAQLAAALGARVLGVVSSEAKADVARRAGAQEAVPADRFREAVAELTDGRGVDIVVDPVGGERFTDSLRCLATEGRLLVIGFVGGDIPTVRVNRLLLNNTEVVGVAWGEFAMRNPDYPAVQWRELSPHLEAGSLDPLVSSVYPLERAAEALSDMEQRRATGKVVLKVR